MREHAFGVERDRIAANHVAVIAADRVPEPVPGSNVVPREARGDAEHVLTLFQDHAIERIELETVILAREPGAWRSRKALGCDAQCGTILGEFAREGARGHHKHGGVPEVLSR